MILLLLLLAAGFVAIYFVFVGDCPIPAGVNLEKSDWLAFVGGYLSFAGTLVISVITILQTTYYNNNEASKQAKERINTIRPIFAISFLELCEASDDFNISLTNVGEYPISNIIVNGHYLYQLLAPSEAKNIVFSYSDPQKHKLLESEYEKSEIGYPKNIIINYEDIDGNSYFQVFEMKPFDGTYYYSLEAIEEA